MNIDEIKKEKFLYTINKKLIIKMKVLKIIKETKTKVEIQYLDGDGIDIKTSLIDKENLFTNTSMVINKLLDIYNQKTKVLEDKVKKNKEYTKLLKSKLEKKNGKN